MKMRFPIVCCFLAIAVFSACKKDSTRESSVAQPSAPAMPAPAASAPTAPATDASADASAKMAAAEWAMKQNEIKTDPNGQWAIQASASSTYGDAQGVASFSRRPVLLMLTLTGTTEQRGHRKLRMAGSNGGF